MFNLSGKLFNRKNLLLVVLIYVWISIYVEPLKTFSAMSHHKVAPWILPFLLTDTNFLIFFLGAVIYFFSDAPFMNRWNTYYLMRCGRKQWVKEQIRYIFVCSLIITIVLFILTGISLIPYLQIESSWGKTLYTMAQTNSGEMCDLFWNISAQFISKHSVIETMGMTVLIMVLGIMFLGVLIFWGSLFRRRYLGIVFPTGLVVMSYLVTALGIFTQKKSAMLSPAAWLRIADYDVVKYGYKIAPPFLFSFFMYAGFVLIFILLLKSKVSKMDFTMDEGK